MARVVIVEDQNEDLQKSLSRSFQSGHLNFLLGSGASLPGIPIAGQVEAEIAALVAAGQQDEAREKMYEFLASVQEPTNALIGKEHVATNAQAVAQYSAFLNTVESILAERRTTLLHKQATIFTTNYDLFIEQASIGLSTLNLNDGFSRVPSLDNRMEYSPRNFFNTLYNTGNLYRYKVEIPSVNLIKLHGSLSWKKSEQEILFEVSPRALLPPGRTAEDIREFVDNFAVVLPQAAKFRTTLMDRTYYELLRIYANQLDLENSLLVTFGFSFFDEHIRDITRRALKNPTLRLVVFAFDQAARTSLTEIFQKHSNVEIISPPNGAQLDFSRFNEILGAILPKSSEELV